MKYSDTNKPLVCMQTQSTCYKGTRTMSVLGVLWHSTGANNPTLKRYIQPSDNDPNRSTLLNIIGKNTNRNDWNHISVEAGLNCWIGKLADGTVATVQTMPWNYRPWGCGSGSKGSCNSGWIQFEICEDSLTDKNYFDKVYKEACEITAYLCKLYNINPHGTVRVNGVNVPTILCHHDSYKLGMGSNHSDILHWFSKFGKTMVDARNDVLSLIKAAETKIEEDEDMDQSKFNNMFNIAMSNYRAGLRDNDSGDWSAEARRYAIDHGIFQGSGTTKDGKPNYMWEDFLTREQCAAILYRFAKLNGLA